MESDPPKPRRSIADDPDVLAGLDIDLSSQRSRSNADVMASIAEIDRRMAEQAEPSDPLADLSTIDDEVQREVVATAPGVAANPQTEDFNDWARIDLPLQPPPSRAREARTAPPPRIVRRAGTRAAAPSSHEPVFLYHSRAYNRAAQDLGLAIMRREPIILVTGQSGVGKTMLCRAVIKDLDRRTLTSLVDAPFQSLDAFLIQVLVDFGVMSRDELGGSGEGMATTKALVGALKEFVASLAVLQASALVLIDRAQTMTTEALVALGALVDEIDAGPLLAIVLAGDSALTERLGRDKLAPVARRIAARIELEPIDADEVGPYAAQSLAAVSGPAFGGSVEVDDRALPLVYAATSGVPQELNRLLERAVAIARERSSSVLNAKMLKAAASSLNLTVPVERRQLPTAIVLLLLILVMLSVGAAVSWVLYREDLQRIMMQVFGRAI